MSAYLTSENWIEFEKKYPDAMAFIRTCELKNEYRYLKDNEYILNDWQKARFLELEKLEHLLV